MSEAFLSVYETMGGRGGSKLRRIFITEAYGLEKGYFLFTYFFLKDLTSTKKSEVGISKIPSGTVKIKGKIFPAIFYSREEMKKTIERASFYIAFGEKIESTRKNN